jgi:hypothetical protein
MPGSSPHCAEPIPNRLGSKTSPLVGTGAEHVLNHNVSFSVELESYGKISNQVKGNSLTVGTRFTF